jgi:decaprenyl-phosphate phosphoribosyltransferase
MAALNDRSGEEAPDLEPSTAGIGRRARDYLGLVRPQQWVKNGFVAMPLLLTPEALDGHGVASVLLAVAAFCLVASAGYVANDMADREADRAHPTKSLRALASGRLSVSEAAAVGAVLLAVGLAAAFVVSSQLLFYVIAYLAVSTTYTYVLKHRAILDVMGIAAGFVLRVEAGAAAIGVAPSVWIIVCTGLLALFLALAKRRDDLVFDLGTNHRRSLAGYNKPFLDASLIVVIGASFVAYVIYTTDAQVMARLGTEHLYLTIPFVLAGILRYLQITLVEERSGSPTSILLSDRFTGLTVAGWLVSLIVLIHF